MIGILPKNLSPPDNHVSRATTTTTVKKYIDHTSSSLLSLPPATVPLHLLTKIGAAAHLYGNFAKERGGYSYDSTWVYKGLVCRIWEKRESGMVPLNRLRVSDKPLFVASDECTNRWVEKENATIEFTVGYVYRSDSPCPAGALPLYSLYDPKIGQCFTVSESEKDICIRFGAKDFGIHCYVAPP